MRVNTQIEANKTALKIVTAQRDSLQDQDLVQNEPGLCLEAACWIFFLHSILGDFFRVRSGGQAMAAMGGR